MHSIKPKTALISLSDKSGLDELVSFLISQDVKILSTGGTYKAIKELTSEVIEVSDFTGFKEMMDGRVKTLHPKIHAGILARRDHELDILKERGYEPIDLVIVNLYPFKETYILFSLCFEKTTLLTHIFLGKFLEIIFQLFPPSFDSWTRPSSDPVTSFPNLKIDSSIDDKVP